MKHCEEDDKLHRLGQVAEIRNYEIRSILLVVDGSVQPGNTCTLEIIFQIKNIDVPMVATVIEVVCMSYLILLNVILYDI